MVSHADLEKLKGNGTSVHVGGVRHVPAPRVDEAFELGRLAENEATTYLRDALHHLADFYEYEGLAWNPTSVTAFVEWLEGGEVGKSLGDFRQFARNLVKLLWPNGGQGMPLPNIGSDAGRDAIADAVRVAVESLGTYADDRGKAQSVAREAMAAAATERYKRGQAEQQVAKLQMQVEAMKEALAGERERGFHQAFSLVRKAAKKLREESK